jgi:hypothetical protein
MSIKTLFHSFSDRIRIDPRAKHDPKKSIEGSCPMSKAIEAHRFWRAAFARSAGFPSAGFAHSRRLFVVGIIFGSDPR